MRTFKTESQKLLDLMINSIYTNREIFLRELISNASDAVDKLYFRSLTDSSIDISRDSLAINLAYDKVERTITVSDNGIGMTRDELELNLGTIAHSDSFDFKAENAENETADVDIIGQFGVGFYSAFMVGKRVRVVSRSYTSDEAWAWESDGIEGFTIEPAERAEHGTDVIIYLKDNTADERYDLYCDEYGLTDLVRRYSNYVRYPIKLECTVSRMKPRPEDAGEDYQPEFENVSEVRTLNSMIPIWKRKKSEVSDEEYAEFYKSDFHDWEDPARTISLHAEGSLTYDALLFVPSHAPEGIYTRDYKKGLALYSSNVLIMDKCEELLPDYFNFVRGVVDSQDLHLNISRETLQHNGQLKAIARRIEKKIKTELAAMRDNDREAYEKLFECFGMGLKYGTYADYGASKDVLADLLLFYSAKEQKMVTLDEYAAGMPEEQEAIYYAFGESREHLAKMPIVNAVLAKGFDVLLCTDNVDEFCMMTLGGFGGETEGAVEKPIRNVAGEDLGLETEEEKAAAEALASENEELLGIMAEALGEKVEKVTVSAIVTEAPAVLTTEGFMTLQMAYMLRRAPGGMEGAPEARVALELNPKHPVFGTLKAAHAAGDDAKVRLFAEILYDQALLVVGLSLEDPIAFAQKISTLLK